MEINTKFNIGDEVLVLHKKSLKARKGHIIGISIYIGMSCTNTRYDVYHKEDFADSSYDEKDVFTTKEELLFSL